MVFPGLSKLGQELNFKNNKKFFYGFVKSSYVMFGDGMGFKQLWFTFPHELDEEDKNKILSWKKKGYASKINLLQKDPLNVMMMFSENFVPFKISKIKEIIDDLSDYFQTKYPESKPKCAGENCTAESNLDFYSVDGIPLPLCPSCIKRMENDAENALEEQKLQPDNYVKGAVFALLFSIPGILLTFILFMLGKIAGVSGLAYYYLSQKGYLWAKGKLNKIGVIIISLSSFIFTAIGTFVSYVAYIVIEVMKNPLAIGLSVIDAIKVTFNTVLTNDEVTRELLANILLSLFLCGICIIANMVQSLKNTGKTKITKL